MGPRLRDGAEGHRQALGLRGEGARLRLRQRRHREGSEGHGGDSECRGARECEEGVPFCPEICRYLRALWLGRPRALSACVRGTSFGHRFSLPAIDALLTVLREGGSNIARLEL